MSVLAEGQEQWSQRFATVGPEKFLVSPLLTGPSGVPLVPGALAHIECQVASALPHGDHTIYVGGVTALRVEPGRPLLLALVLPARHRKDEETGEPAA